MSYVDAWHNKDKGVIHVVERVNGERIYKDIPADYSFYNPDPKGKFRTAHGQRVNKISCASFSEFSKESRIHAHNRLCESDINVVNKCLETYYKDLKSPDLHIVFFDIETDFDTKLGYAPVDDPFNSITAITFYLSWTDQLITFVMPPPTISIRQAREIVDKFENTFLYTSEKDMLNDTLAIIDDADILSGWNSESYDIPYTVNRVTKILGKNATRKFCLWNKYPKKRSYEKYGAESITFDLTGRIHLDLMLLYQKYTYHEMHSYSLDAIGEYELDERKVAYTGTLDDLYKQDFKLFIDYSRQDTFLLHKLDKKLKFIDLANEIAHDNTVLLPKTMGAVAVTEQAIINETHRRGFVVLDNKKSDGETAAAGAYVAYPTKGLHKWVGSLDINSLYPSAIMAGNWGPETLIGQIRQTKTDAYIKSKMDSHYNAKGKEVKGDSFAASWEGIFSALEYTDVMNQTDDILTIDWEHSGESHQQTAKEIYDMIFAEGSNLGISANGTIFTYETEGIIAGLLARWYSERKILQAKKRKFDSLKKGIKIPERLLGE